MSSTTALHSLRFELTAVDADPVLEFVAYQFPPDGAYVVGWPAAPGDVRHAADGRPVLLHFAPARWLVPAPCTDTRALVEAAIEAGAGASVDATGKWRQFHLSGPDATRLLGLSLDSEAALDGRGCAAVLLFDCPGVLAQAHDGYAIWIRSSYAVDFVGTCSRLRESPRGR